MFDDVNKQGKQTVPGAQEPIDIFSEADASAPTGGEIIEEGVKTGGFPVKMIGIILGGVVVVGVIGFGVYQFVLKGQAPAPAPSEEILPFEEAFPSEEPAAQEQAMEEITGILPTQETDIVTAPLEGAPVSAQSGTTQSSEIVPVAPSSIPQAPAPISAPSAIASSVDTDGDGLTDAEEAQYGTDPNVVDTDNDGLSDREEIQVYKTDPLNPDSDGDGFSDGMEVKNGYNPNGQGKLITIPSQP
jgi:hypothetical protein